MMITNEGIIIEFKVSDLSTIGRNTSGVKLMNIDKNSDVKVAKIAKVRENPKNNDSEEIVESDDNSENSSSSETIENKEN